MLLSSIHCFLCDATPDDMIRNVLHGTQNNLCISTVCSIHWLFKKTVQELKLIWTFIARKHDKDNFLKFCCKLPVFWKFTYVLRGWYT